MRNMNTYKSFVLQVFAFIGTVCLLTSCSGKSYLNAIPGESTALISVDLQKMADQSSMKDKAAVLQSLLQVKDVSDCGIDAGSKMVLFEAPDGNLGLCAKVGDEGDLEDWLETMSRKGTCQKPVSRRGLHFTVLKNAWLMGFSDEALLVMGPVTVSAQAELMQQMATYLKEDEDEGIRSNPMFDRLDTIDAPMAMVAQAQALPEKLIAPFTLGAPKNTNPAQVLIAATLSTRQGCLDIVGQTFSFDKGVDEALKKAEKIYRPIRGHYAATMPSDALMGIFMNVDGKQFLPLMQVNKGLQSLLAGINAAIDMDNIMRSVNGDMNIILPVMNDNQVQMMMGAQLSNSRWLADVDYWKQSVPKGGKITDWGPNAYFYTDGKTNYYFGVSKDIQYYSGSSAVLARNSIARNPRPVPPSLQQRIAGKKVVMVINLGGMQTKKNTLSLVSGFLRPLFGEVKSIVYTLK